MDELSLDDLLGQLASAQQEKPKAGSSSPFCGMYIMTHAYASFPAHMAVLLVGSGVSRCGSSKHSLIVLKVYRDLLDIVLTTHIQRILRRRNFMNKGKFY